MRKIIEEKMGQLRQQLHQQQLRVYSIRLEIDRLEKQIASLQGQLAIYRHDWDNAVDAIKITEVGIMTCEALLEEQKKVDMKPSEETANDTNT